MKDEDKKIILLAAKVIKEHCFKKYVCENCCLYDGEECLLTSKPEFWELNIADGGNNK